MRIPILPTAPRGIGSRPGTSQTATYTVIYATTLIPGRGEPIKHGAVVIKGSKIAWVGPYHDCPEQYLGVSPVRVPVAMPGLWDVHVHYMGQGISKEVLSSALSAYLPASPVQAGAITVGDLRNTLMAGYTSVRELGGYGGDLWPLVQAGTIVGPNIYSSIGVMSISGGHGDDHAVPYDTVRAAQGHSGYLDECMKTVRLLVRRGARCIKVCSSGGVLSLLDDPEDRQFSDDELRAIVEEAARSGRAVAAHAIGKAGIMAALRAGVKSIEHGMYLDDEAADLMLEKGAFFVGTHHVVMSLAENLDLLPEPLKAKVIKLKDKADSSYKLAIRKGVKMALGTDTFSSDPSQPLCHGRNARELHWAVQLGMAPLQAIEASTANAAETLGGKAPLSGQLKEGYDADLLCLSANPAQDIGVLGDATNITHIWKGGELYKQP
jgi:imidazolonepropionase-like amidohydrolase